MPSLVNRKLVDSKGDTIKPQTLYAFFALFHDKITGAKQGEERAIEGYYLGNSREAHDIARQYQVKLEAEYPASKISVQKHAMELVGPMAATQVVALREQAQNEQMVAGYLAQVIAEKEAEASLEINPDLTLEVRVDTVLKNAHAFVADQVRMFYEQQAAQKSGLLGPDGKPVAVEKSQKQDLEVSAEDEAVQAELNREMREEVGLGKVLTFPGGNSIRTEDGAEGLSETSDSQVEEPILA